MINIPEYKDLTDFPAYHFLQINTCGIRRVVDHDLMYLRSKGRKDYLLLYIRSGTLTVWFGDIEQNIEAGKCLLYLPGTMQKYVYFKENNPIVLYCHFVGPAADEAIKVINPNGNILFDIHNKTIFESLFYQLTQIYYMELFRTKSKPIFHLEANGVLIQLLSMLEDAANHSSSVNENTITIAVRHFIRHYREKIDMEAYSAELNLSTSRFSHLFTKHVGMSPHKFILNLRINEAKDMLVSSMMNIAAIAAQVGFTDASYFSRLFIKYTGVTPFAYRNENHESID